MDELLQRMLDVDREGDEAVKAAEAQAAALREAASKEAAQINASGDSQTAAECQKILSDATAECEAKRKRVLTEAEVKLKARGEQLSAYLAQCRDELFAKLLGG